MRDIVFAILGLALFALFCAILIAFVPHADLIVTVLVVLAMTAYDFVRELFLGKKDGG